MRVVAIGALLGSALLLGGCGQDDRPAPKASDTGPPRPAASVPAPAAAGDPARGRQVWLGQCVACHNPDPSKDGPVGPAVKGASRELLEARMLRGEYPPGYTPKRNTNVMPPRPDLAPNIPDLAAYLR